MLSVLFVFYCFSQIFYVNCATHLKIKKPDECNESFSDFGEDYEVASAFGFGTVESPRVPQVDDSPSSKNLFAAAKKHFTNSTKLASKTFESRISPNTSSLLVLMGEFKPERIGQIRGSPDAKNSPPKEYAEEKENYDEKEDEYLENEKNAVNQVSTVQAPTLSTRYVDYSFDELKEMCVESIKDGDARQLAEAFDAVSLQGLSLSQFAHSLFDDDEGSYSLLHLCMKYENYEIFTELLNSGLNPNLVDGFRRDALEYACDERKLLFVQILLSFRPIVKESHILKAVSMGFIEVVEAFLEAGIDIIGTCGKKALEITARRKDIRMEELLKSSA